MKIYVEKNAGLTDFGREIDRRVMAALRPIADFCVKHDADLRVANHVAAQALDAVFTEAVLSLAMEKRKNERRAREA